jgi:hypothetical protein
LRTSSATIQIANFAPESSYCEPKKGGERRSNSRP